MTLAAPTRSSARDFVALSRRFLDALGPDGLGSDFDQRQFVVDGIEPSWVLLPATVSEAAEALRLCAEHDLAVVPAGLGARLAYGAPPDRLDAVLSTSRMTALLEHAAADLTLTVEAGATLASVNETLRPHGQWLPFDPPRASETTVGGLIAVNAAGPSRQAYGTVRESLIGVRALLADGTAVKSGGRVVKNVAGYDLQKLLVGSLGTLAVIVEATFKLRPLAAERKLLAWSAPTVEVLTRAGAKLADSTLEPELVEVLAGGEHPPLLVAGFSGRPERVADAEQRVDDLLGALGAERSAPAPAERAILTAAGPQAVDAVVLRAGMRRDALGPWIAAIFAHATAAAAKPRVAAHAGIGVAHLTLESVREETVREIVATLREGACRAGGYLVVESAPALWKRSIDVWGPIPAGFDLLQGVKRAYDPRRLLSPGRFVGGL